MQLRISDHQQSDETPNIRTLFRDADDAATYAAEYLDTFNTFVGKYGREATTYEQQWEAARLSAETMVSDPRFRMTYQHHSQAKNVAMVAAMLYWRGYKDILSVEEASLRRQRYIEALPVLGRLRMGAKPDKKSH